MDAMDRRSVLGLGFAASTFILPTAASAQTSGLEVKELRLAFDGKFWARARRGSRGTPSSACATRSWSLERVRQRQP
jgi:hypothetical protein